MSAQELGLTQPLEYYLELVRSAPKIPVDDPRVLAWQTAVARGEDAEQPYHQMYSDNLYFLFDDYCHSLQQGETFNGGLGYLEKVQTQPQWETFLVNNGELVSKISETMEIIWIYREILVADIKLNRDRHYQESDQLSGTANHPLGYEATGMYAWDRLNPLLRQAEVALKNSAVAFAAFGDQ